MRASYRPAFWSVPTLRRQTGMESERGGARTGARNPLFRVQCLRPHPYGRKEALIAKVRQTRRTDVARADQAGQARPSPFECAACGNRVKSSNTDRFFFWYMSFDNGFMGRLSALGHWRTFWPSKPNVHFFGHAPAVISLTSEAQLFPSSGREACTFHSALSERKDLGEDCHRKWSAAAQ